MSTALQKTRAHQLVQAFRTRTTNVVWFSVQRAEVANGLDDRIDSPDKISQNNTEWCGYASLLYHVADREPESYAEFVIGLFENGRSRLSLSPIGAAVPIEVSESVRREPPPTFLDSSGTLSARMPQADYVALAGLRNHFKTAAATVAESIPLLNLLDDIHGSGGGELCNALKKLGCQQTYDQSGAFSTRDLGYLKAAGGHYDAKRIVILFIDASLLKTDQSQSGRGNHWVALASSVTFSADQKNVQFEVFSWGQKYPINTTAHVVQLRFFGYVVGY